ncbi:(4Fe-4S)-binding protein [Robiginitalea aurantiaca]|uniref:(4Fe-4S)-binding protein n=1 Tax=Robiginitalea aurantiaca TaxID=3056915 RepID=A0ABT7WH07_9FLAO|nr:(4Fe-4S)-binding protein [Robiginitalea aurantiaca]MDM9632196.1 (4Fe-4S)-binding protein [Robiginitalea aurantiaca]
MNKKEITKHYDKDGFSVIWKPAKCIHSEICVKMLPEVYRPDEKPWIRPEAATIDDLKDQIGKCPSGALTYREKDNDQDRDSTAEAVEINVLAGGPLLVSGSVKIRVADQITQTDGGNVSLCRCGASDKKPYCDGSHKKLDFD